MLGNGMIEDGEQKVRASQISEQTKSNNNNNNNASIDGTVDMLGKPLTLGHDNLDVAALQRKPLGAQSKAVWRQQLMVLLGNSGVIGSGMVVAMPSVTLGQLMNAAEPFTLNSDEASWFASINSMACPLGGLLVSYLLDRIGRRYTILLTNIVGLLGWLLLATAFLQTERDHIYWQLLLGRSLGGIMIGLCISPVGVYSAEISLPSIRGRLILCTSIALAGGILVMYVLGYFIRSNFVLLSIICGVYQLLTTLLVLPMPESPSWLMQQGSAERARQSLKYFRGLKRKEGDCIEEFEKEFGQIKFDADQSRHHSENDSLWQTVQRREVCKPLVLMIGLLIFQQFTGVVIIIVFAVQIATRAGVTIDPSLVAVLVGVARIITTCFMSGIFERWGRVPAGVLSATGMGLCMMLLAAGGWFPTTVGLITWLPVVCIMLHIVFSTMGMLTLPFIMLSEVFPQNARGIGSGIAIFCGMIISFVVVKVYPDMDAAFGTSNLFAFYGLLSFLAVLYIYFLLPETRGRTLFEIEEHFRTGHKLATGAGSQRENNLKDVELNEVFLKK